MDEPYRSAQAPAVPAPRVFVGRDASTPLWLALLYVASCGAFLRPVPVVMVAVIGLVLLLDHEGRRYRLKVGVDGYELTRYRFGVIPLSRRRFSLAWEVEPSWDDGVDDIGRVEGMTWSHARAPFAGGPDGDGDGSPMHLCFGPSGRADKLQPTVDAIREAAAKMRSHAASAAT